MTRCLSLLILVSAAFAAPPPKDALDALKGITEGYVAHCKQSLVDELQIVAGPKKLSKDEAKALASFFGSDESYERRKLKTFCSPYYDFKFLLYDRERDRVVSLRLCTSCDEVVMEIDYTSKLGVTLDQDARKVLYRRLDAWFPGWQELSAKNRREWVEQK